MLQFNPTLPLQQQLTPLMLLLLLLLLLMLPGARACRPERSCTSLMEQQHPQQNQKKKKKKSTNLTGLMASWSGKQNLSTSSSLTHSSSDAATPPVGDFGGNLKGNK